GREAGGGRNRRIEVAGAAAVDGVAVAVAARGAHQREVGAQRRLEQVAPTAELALLLATRDVGADSRGGVEGRQPRAAGAHALDQGALRHELELDGSRPDARRPGRRLLATRVVA